MHVFYITIQVPDISTTTTPGLEPLTPRSQVWCSTTDPKGHPSGALYTSARYLQQLHLQKIRKEGGV